ncbi:MAG: T9SS type A sorting domain-containing protein, partial [Bacteroidetes bacterium]|nr:T9SS type A sorting domain-containing protein [Bacteroidota bacterium]
SWKPLGDSIVLNISQTPSSKTVNFFQTSIDIKLKSLEGDTVIRLYQNKNPQIFKIKCSKKISTIEFDPRKWLLKKVFTITNLPEIPSDDDYFEVSPLPFGDHLNINFQTEPFKGDQIRIIGLNGSVLFQTTARKKKEITINTNFLSPGIYLLVITSGQNKYVRKVIKSNNEL